MEKRSNPLSVQPEGTAQRDELRWGVPGRTGILARRVTGNHASVVGFQWLGNKGG